MSKGFGWMEREIIKAVDVRRPVLFSSRDLIKQCWGWEAAENPTIAQRNSAQRAMRTFVQKAEEFALTSPSGAKKRLHVYRRSDPVSRIWAELSSASVKPVSLHAVRRHLREMRT